MKIRLFIRWALIARKLLVTGIITDIPVLKFLKLYDVSRLDAKNKGFKNCQSAEFFLIKKMESLSTDPSDNWVVFCLLTALSCQYKLTPPLIIHLSFT